MKPSEHPCERCGAATPLAIGIRRTGQTPLCGPCQLLFHRQVEKIEAALPEKQKAGVFEWWRKRDAAVKAAFETFVGAKPKKGQKLA